MSLTENGNGMYMPVAPAYGGGYGNGFGGFGGDWGSLIVLFLIAAMFGGFGGNWGGGFGGGFDGAFPWLMSGQAGINANTNAGFDNAAVGSQLSGIQTSLTTGFSNAEVSGCNRAMDAMQTAYSNQIASMNQRFADVTAIGNRLDDIGLQLQNGTCENRASIADLKYTVATEACADRNAVNNALRDVLVANNANTQRILDTMNQDKIDAKNEKILELQNQLNMATLRESQIAQNAFIQQGFADEVDQLYNRLSNCPVPTTPVYGRTPIFTCNNGGCGCNGGF